MTAFCSHQDRLHELAGVTRSPLAASSRPIKRLGAQVRRAIGRLIAAFSSRDNLFFERAAYQSPDPDSDAAKFPQRPLILGDKWDF